MAPSEATVVKAPSGKHKVKIEGTEHEFDVDVFHVWHLWSVYYDQHKTAEDGQANSVFEIAKNFLTELTGGQCQYTQAQAWAFRSWLNQEMENLTSFFDLAPTSPGNADSTPSG